MPQSVPKGLTREHVLRAIAELDAGAAHPFGEPTGYEVLHEGRSYPPKAVVGLAARHLLGRPLLPAEFSGGNAAGQANAVLRVLGFTVVKMAAVEVERRRLSAAGRDDLAARVVWASQDWGDGLGYDVLSFSESDESERYVEVKTTGLGKFFPFIVTANEVRCSEAATEKFHLYRVFEFGRSPRLYVLRGALPGACRLEPVAYRATI